MNKIAITMEGQDSHCIRDLGIFPVYHFEEKFLLKKVTWVTLTKAITARDYSKELKSQHKFL